VDNLLRVDRALGQPIGHREEYRAEWARSLTEAGNRYILPSTGWYATWDDHEVDNWSPETIDPERLTIAKESYFEPLAVEQFPDFRLWASYQWGDTAEIIVMDLRSERLASTRRSDEPVFISAARMAFVKQRLMSSTAHFKLIMSSVDIANLAEAWDAPLGFNDRWEGYGGQRTELLDFIVDNQLQNVRLLAGDIHVGFVGRVEPPGHKHAKLWEITVGPGASETNPLGDLWEADTRAALRRA
jgi:phosphodiesterase/alkaline phosphatase D-like protein